MGVPRQLDVVRNISNSYPYVAEKSSDLVSKVNQENLSQIDNWKQRNIENYISKINHNFDDNKNIQDSQRENRKGKKIMKFAAAFTIGTALFAIPFITGCNQENREIIQDINQAQEGYKINEESDIVEHIDNSTYKITGFLDSISVDESQKNCTISIYNVLDDKLIFEEHSTSFQFSNISYGYKSAFDDAKKEFGLDNLIVDLYFYNDNWSGTGIYPSNNKDINQGIKRMVVLREGMDKNSESFSVIGHNLDNNMIEVLTSHDEKKIDTFNLELVPGVKISVHYKTNKGDNFMWNELISYEKLTEADS
jgi:hypothetical protein